MNPQIKVLEDFFAAINRFDLDAMTRDFDPQIERIEPEEYETAGTYHGIDAVREHVRKGRGTWAEGSCDPEEFHVNGDRVVVYLHARVRLHDASEWIGGRFADGFEFRDGKIATYRTFWERAAALEWAGLDA
jgi:ketosteroid isomerase-like protein